VTSSAERPIVTSSAAAERALDAGGGIVRLAPTWVPRAFCTPGGRLKLHPDDLYPFAGGRGGIDERWLASTVHADNGPGTPEWEGVSMVVGADGELIPFDGFVAHHGARLLGEAFWAEHAAWPMYSKFFDNMTPLPLHVHHRDADAAALGRKGKPEAYYFAPQMNPHLGTLPLTYFGLHPGTTRDEVRARLERFGTGGDNRITELSRGFRIELGTGWDVPAGVLHAPASVCTYEPQRASDVFAMCESWTNSREVPPEMLWKDVPQGRVGDLEYILDILDWERNTEPGYRDRNRMVPVETSASVGSGPDWTERWIVYLAAEFSAKELTVAPGATVTIRDTGPYGCIVVQGRGTLGGHAIAAPTLIRYGQLTEDELYVSAAAATAGVVVTNPSAVDPLVILKHFGPENPELVADRAALAGLRRG
jgi:hypothetical protein